MPLVIAPINTLSQSLSLNQDRLTACGLDPEQVLRQVLLSYHKNEMVTQANTMESVYHLIDDTERFTGKPLNIDHHDLMDIVDSAVSDLHQTLSPSKGVDCETVVDARVSNGLCFITAE